MDLSAIETLLALPRDEQVAAARSLIATLPPEQPPEAWNSAFGPQSLFDAWTRTSIARDVHGRLAEELASVVRPGIRIVDVGGGNGVLWRSVLADVTDVELVVVDVLDEAVQAVRNGAPDHVDVRGIVGPVQDVELPDCDVVVCSMTLHHVAGRDAAERASVGMSGAGKVEVLRAFGRALSSRAGLGFLVEADVDCEVDLAPGDPVLRDNIFDSYMRRCGRAILDDARDLEQPLELRERWAGLLRFWFLEQLAVADAPLVDRDVYELTVPRWTALFEQAGLELVSVRPMDEHALFQRYAFR